MRLQVVLGELVDQPAQALVRVVTPGRRGQDEAGLLDVAGPAVRQAFRELLRLEHAGSLPAAAALVTGAGALPARHLVHVAVPPWTPRTPDRLLPAAYRATLATADAVGARTVALIPFGMTQPYWPIEVSVRLAVSTLPNIGTGVREITLVVRTPAALEPLASALTRR